MVIKWYDELDSTNDEAIRVMSKLESLSVIAAKIQNRGRGQYNRIWLTNPGENLTFTVVVKYGEGIVPKIKTRDVVKISMAAANSVVALLDSYNIASRIKLPNDIYVGDSKICGILMENYFTGNDLVTSIVGVGLNVNQRYFPTIIPNPTSLALQTNMEYDLNEVLSKFIEIFKLKISAI